ncbi:pimeloyl-ACP methyl ester carboxylesterase [Caulobacter ginsengisoli]|uniref:Pimeloyl-ACP methyl ester carboxylesterase n=1 Tax=Caulobacter ginsengisoli TaxID=400775 RepID=A0ABU0IRA5_9CAUL|nr:alpha/beta hydrolase [Caulobacter ginsengisoli]MDQ0464545.1 pimeloyl-ACP methyl ester carboxylesterase [Caulobacter ginsengisoli]
MFKFLKTLAALAAMLIPLALAGQAAATPTRFTVEVRGKGPDVVLIPGLASSRAVWDDTAKRLEGRYRLHIIQVNGFAGQTPGPNASGPVVAPLIEEIDAYIRDQKLDHPAVIGHSMGGYSALALAAAHPGDVGKVMVVDALPFFSVLFGPGVTVAQVEPQATAFKAQMLAMSKAQFDAGQPQVMARLAKTPAAQALAAQWAIASDRQVMAQATYDIMTSDLRPQLAAITVPVTVVYARDPVMGEGRVDALYKENYAALPGVKLQAIDGGFHFIMLDQPDAFAAAVEAFLK